MRTCVIVATIKKNLKVKIKKKKERKKLSSENYPS